MKPILTLPCKNKHFEMKKTDQGYYCQNCDHVLRDFRKSSDEDIQEAIHSSNSKICGVFNPNQLDFKTSQLQIPAFRTVGLSLLGILGFLGPVLISCENQDNAQELKQNAFNLLKFPMHVRGKVIDEKSGKPLPFFMVELLQHNKTVKTSKTDKEGNFDILVTEKDLDEEVFNLVVHRNGFEHDTTTTNLSKFRNKKVRLTIQAMAVEHMSAPGKVAPKITECSSIQGEIIPSTFVEEIPYSDPDIELPKASNEGPQDQIMDVVGVIITPEPEFPGGQEALYAFIKSNLVYPQNALEKGIGGKVHVRFEIAKDGSVTNVKLNRGIPDCKECNDEAIRVIKSMPKWKPAKQDGFAVSSYYNLPITFKP